MQHGPIAVSFEVTSDFMTYKKGVYHKVRVQNPHSLFPVIILCVGYRVGKGWIG